ncbi:helix-turn-helix domain-containing protein [Oscillochloris sp. ZM17-4]|uniref:helix-turn-helix domain-containing protein n=1 Tax=Oscillochloris sp. ZM17-4 TaxID=2866714 RepID=UPI001C72C2AE|nr:helix-turn-helix domain-containing protein [Oscillochloris sp. ZM17-4]MBX0329902.1 helix-turn-helix domain-containing protein [Oscillochloris sp. ZM17-4]
MSEELAHPAILTVAEVARYLRVSETTVWRWCTSGKLPAFRIGRSWRVRRDTLDQMIAGTPPLGTSHATRLLSGSEP